MSSLNPTPMHRLVDAKGRPYFLWDSDMTIDAFRRQLESDDDEVRAYYVGKLMRQAKPDDVFQFVDLNTIRALWPRLSPYLGQRREMWEWLLAEWDQIRDDGHR